MQHMLAVSLFFLASNFATPRQAPEQHVTGGVPAVETPSETVTTMPQLRRVDPPGPSMSAQELEQRGDELRLQKALPDALDFYQAALAKAPSAALYNKIGMSHLMMFHHDLALKAFNKSLKLNKEYPDAYNNRGVVYYIKKNYGRAIKDYQHAIRLREDLASYYSNLGTAYFEHKEFDKARQQYLRALSLDPDIFERKGGMGVSAHLVSSVDRAHYSFVIARMYAEKGDNDHALLYIRKALEEGYPVAAKIKSDNDFNALKKDPRFIALMENRPVALPQ